MATTNKVLEDGTVVLEDGRRFSGEEFTALLEKLRADFPKHQVEKLPRPLSKGGVRGKCVKGSRDNVSADGYHCGGYHAYSIHLDYIGHATITDRLNSVDPYWEIDFDQRDQAGAPVIDFHNGLAYFRLTILGITKLCVGDAGGKALNGNGHKELLGDAIRNGAMRFGVGTYLWSKSEEAERRKSGEFAEQEDERQAQTAQVVDQATAVDMVNKATEQGAEALESLKRYAQKNGWDVSYLNEINRRIASARGTN